MFSIKKHIPNFITSLNLLCGCLAIIETMNNNLQGASYLVGAALVFDYMDGMLARLLKVHSEIGKQLDSLADVVTFGVVPGMLLFKFLEQCLFPFPHIAFLIPLFSALRLAKFNVDVRQTTSFIGVPTPANTILIASFPLILKSENFLNPFILNPYFLVGITLMMSYLLIAEIPLFSLKFKNMAWQDNKIQYVFLFISSLLILLIHFVGIPFIIFLYIVLSLINNSVK